MIGLFGTGAPKASVVRILIIGISVHHSSPNAAGHHDYSISSQHFENLTKQDTVFYGSGGPANEMITWRVNDTVSFGNVTILSTTLGAALSIPSGGEGDDGNFGMARCESFAPSFES